MAKPIYLITQLTLLFFNTFVMFGVPLYEFILVIVDVIEGNFKDPL